MERRQLVIVLLFIPTTPFQAAVKRGGFTLPPLTGSPQTAGSNSNWDINLNLQLNISCNSVARSVSLLMTNILQYKNYFASVHFSAGDEVFYGKILGINDLVNFEGSSVKYLKKAFKEAVDDYLALCAEIGKVPEKTYKGTFNVRVPVTLHKEASLFAAVHNITLNEFVKTALAFTLQRPEEVNRLINNDNQLIQTV